MNYKHKHKYADNIIGANEPKFMYHDTIKIINKRSRKERKERKNWTFVDILCICYNSHNGYSHNLKEYQWSYFRNTSRNE